MILREDLQDLIRVALSRNDAVGFLGSARTSRAVRDVPARTLTTDFSHQMVRTKMDLQMFGETPNTTRRRRVLPFYSASFRLRARSRLTHALGARDLSRFNVTDEEDLQMILRYIQMRKLKRRERRAPTVVRL